MEQQIEIAASFIPRLPHNDGLQQRVTSGGPLQRVELERLLVSTLPLVERLSRHFCRGSRMTAEDVEDFIADVRVHLVDDDYAVLRSFQGRCTLPAFLALTIQHLLMDYRAHAWGRFRTSAAATRLGPAAVQLEKLVLRDGKPVAEAVAMLKAGGHELTQAEAERLLRQFPPRKARPVEVDLEAAEPELPAGTDTTEQEVFARDRRTIARTIAAEMRAAMSDLPAEDRTILRLHFDAGLSLADVARSMHLGQRSLYRRVDRICRVLRERLLAAGVSDADVTGLLGQPDSDLEFGLREVGNPPDGSSTGTEGKR